MSSPQHRAPRARRRAATPTRRPRRGGVHKGRLSLTAVGAIVPTVAVVGVFGVVGAGADDVPDATPYASDASLAPGVEKDAELDSGGEGTAEHKVVGGKHIKRERVDETTRSADRETALPAESGQGRRAVYSESRQRVWIVGADERVQRTYLVSGSIYDNLDPGTYSVYSRSAQAWGIDDSGTMEWFVRFTKGDNGAAIGFHNIPEKDGVPLQGKDELGTPTSHGCMRQAEPDALAMWEFAQIGTTVVVTA